MRMDLSNQRRMAAEVLGCGANRVWIDPNAIDEVAEAITRADIRMAIDSGTIRALPKKGVSRGRARHAAAQKAKGRRRGPGSRKGTTNARRPGKREWMQTIRSIRTELKALRADGKIPRSVYREFYRKAKGGMFKNRNHLLSHMRMEGHLEVDD